MDTFAADNEVNGFLSLKIQRLFCGQIIGFPDDGLLEKGGMLVSRVVYQTPESAVAVIGIIHSAVMVSPVTQTLGWPLHQP